MTATAPEIDLDLSWAEAQFRAPSEPCNGLHGEPCGIEAVARARWRPGCAHIPNPTPYCAGHRDEVLAKAAAHDDHLVCGRCLKTSVLIKMEPIR